MYSKQTLLKIYEINEGDKVIVDKGVDWLKSQSEVIFIKEYTHFLLFKRIIGGKSIRLCINKASLLCGHAAIHKV